MAEWVRYHDWITGNVWPYQDTSSATTLLYTPMHTATTSASWTYTSLTTRWRAAQYVATREEIAAAERLRTQRQQAQDGPAQARRRLRESAEAKAEALLLRHLDAVQRQQYRQWSWFEVVVSGHVYRIERGYAGNVTVRDPLTRRAQRRYCIHGPVELPVPDQMLSQLLLVRNNEQEFLRIANVS
jgi:hypothetical protein